MKTNKSILHQYHSTVCIKHILSLHSFESSQTRNILILSDKVKMSCAGGSYPHHIKAGGNLCQHRKEFMHAHSVYKFIDIYV